MFKYVRERERVRDTYVTKVFAYVHGRPQGSREGKRGHLPPLPPLPGKIVCFSSKLLASFWCF